MDEINGIKGAFLTNLKIIKSEKGEVQHFLRNDSDGYVGFGEAYFSTVEYKQIKGWKKHLKMTMNLTVPVGEIKFYLLNKMGNPIENTNNIFSLSISSNNYKRLTVNPGVWVAFEGLSKEKNILINLSNITHDPDESINLPFDKKCLKNIN